MKIKLTTFYTWKLLSRKIGIFRRFLSIGVRKYPKLPLGHPKIQVNVIENLIRITKIPKFNFSDHSESLWNFGLHVSVLRIWYFEPCSSSVCPWTSVFLWSLNTIMRFFPHHSSLKMTRSDEDAVKQFRDQVWASSTPFS